MCTLGEELKAEAEASAKALRQGGEAGDGASSRSTGWGHTVGPRDSG